MNAHHGFIYFARTGAGGIVKIGFSATPDERAWRLSLERNQPVEIIGHGPGSRADERFLHALCWEHRVKGEREWFKWRPTARVVSLWLQTYGTAAGPTLPRSLRRNALIGPWMEKNGINARQGAEMFNITVPTMKAWMTGGAVPHRAGLDQIAAVLRTSPRQVMLAMRDAKMRATGGLVTEADLTGKRRAA